jgi:hypothetical protein
MHAVSALQYSTLCVLLCSVLCVLLCTVLCVLLCYVLLCAAMCCCVLRSVLAFTYLEVNQMCNATHTPCYVSPDSFQSLQATPHAVRGSSQPGVSRQTFAVFMEPNWNEPVHVSEAGMLLYSRLYSSSIY